MSAATESFSRRRPSRLSRWFDGHRHARFAVVFSAIALAVLLAFAAGQWWEDRIFVVDTNVYVAVAGLFIVALAIERVTELAIAPWVGGGDRRMDRNVIVGSFTLVLGVAVSSLLGLRVLSLLGDDSPDTDWLAVSIDVFATGLAIGAGSKPLHDLITNLEKRTKAAKAADAASDRAPIAPSTEPGSSLVPSGGTYRMAIAVATPDAVAPPSDGRSPWSMRSVVEQRVQTLLPDWELFTRREYVKPTSVEPTSPVGSLLVHRATSSVPGSPAFINEQFAAAHRLHGDGLDVTLSPAMVRAGTASAAPNAARHSLGLLKVDALTQRRGRGGSGVRIAVLDTGLRTHARGVPWPVDGVVKVGDVDIVDGDANPEDPLLEGADWRDLDVVGAPGHGTGVAAVIAAPGDSGLTRYSDEWFTTSEMIGVAPEAEIFPIRVMRGPVHLLDDDVAEGVRAAIANHCHIISMSLGGLAFRGLEAAIDEAVEAGIIVICAAGNQFGVVVEPASYPNTIAVASVGIDGEPFFEGSSRGPEVTISAPGVKVVRPDFEIDERRNVTEVLEPGTGTTYATAHVAGVAALWLARHGRDELLEAYRKPQLPRLFAHVLGVTATRWKQDHLAIDWGPGRVDAKAALDEEVLAGPRQPAVNAATLDAVFERKAVIAVTDRFAGGVAAFLRDDGTTEARENVFAGLLTAFRSRSEDGAAANRAGKPKPSPVQVRAATLLGAELRAHAGANANFRRALASATDTLPVPVGATAELALVVDETNREPGEGLPDDWGVGLSRPLKLALNGVGTMRRGYRSVGIAALAAAVLLVVLLDDAAGSPSTSPLGRGGVLALLGIGLFGSAQAIERLLEFTVGRWAFKDVPGREMDRALILLGCGFLVGGVAVMILDLGLLDMVASAHPNDATFRKADVLVTALAIGGGAKPLHDLLTRIQIGKTS